MKKATGFACIESKQPLQQIEYELSCGPRDAIVEVAGCGLCHTDLGFYQADVSPRHNLPLVLGHEISGTVVEAGDEFASLVGRQVIIPAVMPCGSCEHCRAGYTNTCRNQVMPGNDEHGGFADYIRVPAQHLVVVPVDLGHYQLAELAVIADAVTTPYQSVLRSGLKAGDVAIVIGTGGIGSYGVQIAKAFGAHVIALDIDDEKLARVRANGADKALNMRETDPRSAKKQIREMVKNTGLALFGWKIFEMSGAKAGQELAFALIPPSGTLAIVGFTMAKIEVRLSNLMAFDATCFGNWGCDPAHYPAVIDLALTGEIDLKPFIQRHPLSDIQQVFERAHHGELTERAILVP